MNRITQPPPADVPGTAERPSSSHGRLILFALLALLLIGGGIGLTIALSGKSGKDDGEDRRDSRGRDKKNEGPICNDDKDPKGFARLEFGDPIEVPFKRRFLDALSEKQIPDIEQYPWQPKELVAVLGEHRMRGTQFALLPDGKTIA